MMADATTVAVFGGYKHEVGGGVYETAVELGRLIAAEGWAVLNGGYGGSMEATARGAKEAGGHVVGITLRTATGEPNAFIDETYCAEDLWERIRVMLERSDAFVALPGATGTLAEVAMAWELICKGMMKPKPLVLLGDFWQPLYDMLVPQPEARAACGGVVRVLASPRECVDFLRSFRGE
jgi:uncharacterized protein (TIGR00730 family)